MSQINRNLQPLTSVDLFSGGGGLTVGMKQAGFRVVSAVEIEDHAFATYSANHSEVCGFKQDVRELSGDELIQPSPTGKIDLIAGCPPCQGFSSLTSKYRRHDPRNDLVAEMTRIVREVRPSAVMMENVPGLAYKGKRIFEQLLSDLSGLGYKPRWGVLQVADFGVPQSRRRLVLLAGFGFEIPLPEPTHDKTGAHGLQPWRTLKEIIKGLPKPLTLEACNKRGGPSACKWHIVRTLSKANRERLKYAKPGRSRREIPCRFRPECHKASDAGFQNVYGRMSWNSVSPTITAGCTTLSKGRFGHPSQLRTISVYEAALLQTFPPDYVFDTPYMEYACSIVGNALPCEFARIISSQCAAAIRSNQLNQTA